MCKKRYVKLTLRVRRLPFKVGVFELKAALVTVLVLCFIEGEGEGDDDDVIDCKQSVFRTLQA